jgi:hypothetical protein
MSKSIFYLGVLSMSLFYSSSSQSAPWNDDGLLACTPADQSITLIDSLIKNINGHYFIGHTPKNTKKFLSIDGETLMQTKNDWRVVANINMELSGLKINKIASFICKNGCSGYTLYFEESYGRVRETMMKILSISPISGESVEKSISDATPNGTLINREWKGVLRCIIAG